MEEFVGHGHTVFVACSIEKRYGIPTNLTKSNGINVLQYKPVTLLQIQTILPKD
jgi:hypothetical protein